MNQAVVTGKKKMSMSSKEKQDNVSTRDTVASSKESVLECGVSKTLFNHQPRKYDQI